jgi:glycosyl transferase, family 25
VKPVVDHSPVIIINLPESEARRAHMLFQGQRLGLALEFFPAVDGHQPHSLFDHIDHTRRLRYKGRPFTPGERGCWASHYLVWQRCVALNQPVIVLEDDAELCDNFPTLLQAVPKLANQIPYARLYLGDAGSRRIGQIAGHDIHRHWHTPFGTVAYLLTPAAARRFLTHAEGWILAVDDYMDLSWKHGVERLAIAPPAVKLDQAFGSLVRSGEGKPHVPPHAKICREGFRAYLSLRRILQNFRHLP